MQSLIGLLTVRSTALSLFQSLKEVFAIGTGRNEPQYIDGWDGMAKEMAKHATIKRSQCRECENKIGTHKCKVFGERPDQYASVLANVQCPERKVK